MFGVGLIGIAFFVQRRSNADEFVRTPAFVVAQGDVRTVQTAQDTDGDKIPDWEEALNGTDPRVYTKQTAPTPKPAVTTDPYTPPTTLTDRFAEQFFENMVRTGAGKTMTAEEKAKIVNDSISELSGQIQDILYTQADIKSVANSDLATLHTYGNELGDVLIKNSIHNESEWVIFGRAVKGHNPEALKPLKAIESAYAGMIGGLLLLEIPSSFVKQQVDLLNTLSMVHADIIAMQGVFTDPLGALVRIKRYKDDAKGLFYALDNIRTALEARGIAYTNDEPGIFLFSLRP